MESGTSALDPSLFYLIGGIVLVGIIALLYKRFYTTRHTEGTDELNWVNKSNYNIASSDSEIETMENATSEEAAEIVHKMTDGKDSIPPTEEEFYAVNDKLGGAGTTDEVKDALRHPDA